MTFFPSIKEAVRKVPLGPEHGSNSFLVFVAPGELSFDHLPLSCLLIFCFTLKGNSSTYPLVKAKTKKQDKSHWNIKKRTPFYTLSVCPSLSVWAYYIC